MLSPAFLNTAAQPYNEGRVIKLLRAWTEVRKGWRFALLVIGVSLAGVLIFLGLLATVLFRGKSLNVGTTRWALDQLDETRVDINEEKMVVQTEKWNNRAKKHGAKRSAREFSLSM